jgi:hypothetical protein
MYLVVDRRFQPVRSGIGEMTQICCLIWLMNLSRSLEVPHLSYDRQNEDEFQTVLSSKHFQLSSTMLISYNSGLIGIERFQ